MRSMYDPNMVEPMWRELEGIGVRPLRTSEEVDQALRISEGTTLLVVNSVCGCAAGSARPGVALALQNDIIPDRLTTVFAGVDMEATASSRRHMKDVTPSSPSVALFKQGRLVYNLPRQEIEGLSNREVAVKLVKAFNEHCASKGPSVSWEQLKKAFNMQDTIPRV